MGEDNIKKLRKEIEIGEESGFISDFCPEEHLAELQRKHL